MSKTYTPDLPPDVLNRLEDYAAQFRPDFRRNRQADWAHVYLHGLMIDGERKSIEPLSRRVTLPDGLEIADPEQALQNFVNQAACNEQDVGKRYRAVMARTFASPRGIFVIDDTSFPKQGKHSVGVQRQYCGALGKRANCQVAPSIHDVGPSGHFPLAMRLYLPGSWLGDKKRLDKAGVPESERRPLSKGQIALELLDPAGPSARTSSSNSRAICPLLSGRRSTLRHARFVESFLVAEPAAGQVQPHREAGNVRSG